MAVNPEVIQTDIELKLSEEQLAEETFLKDLQIHIAQAASVDGMVSMAEVLINTPNNYRMAFERGQSQEAAYFNEPLSQDLGDTINPKRVELRNLLLAAYKAEEQAIEEGVVGVQLILSIKQALCVAGASKEVARAISIVYGTVHFIEVDISLPTQEHLMQAAAWIDINEAKLNHQAAQLSSYRLLCSLANGKSTKEALEHSKHLKQSILSGEEIESEIDKKTHRFEEQCLAAFTAVQDYGAMTYCSADAAVFNIERTTVGNGLYEAVLKSLQQALESTHPIHECTLEIFSNTIREDLKLQPTRIVNTFKALIQGGQCFGLPLEFVEEVFLLQKKWQTSSAVQQKSVQTEVDTFLNNIAKRYCDFVSQHPEVGTDIELSLVADKYQVQIQKLSHVGTLSTPFNPTAALVMPLFMSVYENRYHALRRHNDLQTKSLDTPEAYIRRAMPAMETGIFKMSNIPAIAAAILSHSNPSWQPHAMIEETELKRLVAFFIETRKLQLTEASRVYQEYRSSHAYQLIQSATNNYLLSITQHNNTTLQEVKLRYLDFLDKLAKAQIEEYERSTSEFINTKRAAIEQGYAFVQGRLNDHKQELAQAYNEQMQSIDNQTTAAINERVAAYQEHECRVAEYKRQRKKAKRKQKLKIIKSIVGIAIGAFISPILAQSLFSGAGSLLSMIGKGTIFGGISSGVGGSNPLKGALQGGLFAGFGNIVGNAVKSAASIAHLKDIIQVAASAGLHTAINGGNVGKNIALSVGASIISAKVLDQIKVDALSNDVISQAKEAVFRPVITGSVSTLLGGGKLGQSLVAGGLGSIQSMAQGVAVQYGDDVANNIVHKQAEIKQRTLLKQYAQTQILKRPFPPPPPKIIKAAASPKVKQTEERSNGQGYHVPENRFREAGAAACDKFLGTTPVPTTSQKPQCSGNSANAQSTKYHPIASELQGYSNGTKDVHIEAATLSVQKRRLQRELMEFDKNEFSIENHTFFSPALQADYEEAYVNTIERRTRLEAEYKKMHQLPKSVFFVYDKASQCTEFSKLQSIKGGIDVIDNNLRSYVRQDLQTHLTSVQSRLSLNCNLQKRQERARTGTELPWYRESAETFQMMTGMYAGASWTMAAGEMERHPGLAFGAMTVATVANPIGTLVGIGAYSVLSLEPAERALQKGVDFGLRTLGFNNPHTRDLLSTPMVEGAKMVLTGGVTKATPLVKNAGKVFLHTTQKVFSEYTLLSRESGLTYLYCSFGPNVPVKWKNPLVSKANPEKNAFQNRQENMQKGIPESVLGPSGRPKILETTYPTRKKAKDGAINNGQKGQAPEHHPNPVKGDPHFHPYGSNSREHHTYPAKGFPRKEKY